TAQESAPAARLGVPISPVVRAQSPDFATAAGLDVTPKVMPKGKVSETGSPNPLPMPTSASPMTGGTAVTIPPGGAVNGPVIIDPPGAPFPTGPIMGDPFGGGCPVGEPCHANNNCGWYTAVEGLIWWVKSYSVPALVTAGPALSGATLGGPGTAVLFGANSVDTNPRYGARVTLGYWLNPCWAVELSAFYVRPTTDRFTASSAAYANQDLARPFFSLNRQIESSEIIGRPGVASGFVQVDSKSTFYGAELNLRHPCWNSCSNHLDFIAGIRYLYLEEQLIISETSRGLGGAGALAGVQRQHGGDFTPPDPLRLRAD